MEIQCCTTSEICLQVAYNVYKTCSTAYLVGKKPKLEHITPILYYLYWLLTRKVEITAQNHSLDAYKMMMIDVLRPLLCTW